MASDHLLHSNAAAQGHPAAPSELVPAVRTHPAVASEMIPALRTHPAVASEMIPAASRTHPTPHLTTSGVNPSRQLTDMLTPAKSHATATGFHPSGRTHMARGDRHTFDDSSMMKQVQATHAPDGRDFDVRPLLHIIEDILHRATPTLPGLSTETHETQAHLDTLEDKILHDGFTEVLDLLSYYINRISSEITCKCAGGGDAHTITLSLFHSLSNFAWDAKVVITLAAFAINYGEFWLVAQLYTTNPLAKSVAILKELPEINARADTLRPKFEAVLHLIRAMLEVTNCIIKFKDLDLQYSASAPEIPDMIAASAIIPTAAYWTIRSIVACATVLMNLVAMGHEYISSTSEAWELSSLAHKLANIREHLEKQLEMIYQKIEDKRRDEAFKNFGNALKTPHLDNLTTLKHFFYLKDDQLPLFDGSNKRKVGLDVLRRKTVLLFISDLDLSPEELTVLLQMYSEAKQHPSRPESQYEVVWLPIIDTFTAYTEARHKDFEILQNSMPWYSVAHPSLIDPAAIRYIKEVWNFNVEKSLLVVLDPQGRESNRNALHMMWIWGSMAYPFTKFKEETLWREETWRIDFLAAGVIDQNVQSWIAEGKYICLYGGENMEWIRQFTTATRAVAKAAQIPLEMLYVGKRNPREKVRSIMSSIQAENLSHVLPDLTLVWFFWARLESMWRSKVQQGMSMENDPIMKEIKTMLAYDGDHQGWAVFSRGSAEMTKANGKTILDCLRNFDRWRDRVVYPNGFVIALDEALHDFKTADHCVNLIFSATTGDMPGKVECPECHRLMEKFVMYRCCID